jgi:cysteine synthase A
MLRGTCQPHEGLSGASGKAKDVMTDQAAGVPVSVEGALGLIGGTALVALRRVHRGSGLLLAKAEFLNPGGSVKDRPALAAVQAARAAGLLRPGGPVVEMTSGNMGAGLAVVCAALGHPLLVTMSAGNSPKRAEMLRGLGAEVVLVPQVDGEPGRVTGADVAAALEAAKALAAERGAFYVDQFNNLACIEAHRSRTGDEILQQTGGRLDAFVAMVGSGGTFIGVMRALKAHRLQIEGVAVEPLGAEILAGKPVVKARHLLQGGGYGLVPALWQSELMDRALAVSDGEATEYRRRLAAEEGLYLGFSAAANVAAASRYLRERGAPAAVAVTILCDNGLKY